MPADIMDLGFAQVDLSRRERQGFPEVIFAQGKTAAQVIAIARQIYKREKFCLTTRATAEQAAAFRKAFPKAVWHEDAHLLQLGEMPPQSGRLAVLCAGTSDLRVAEEAAVTGEAFGLQVARHYDIGVAGLHRLLSRLERIKQAEVLIVVAGMEGALPSVVGGLVPHPVIAVPTSIGYGANFQGLSALLGMLNTCASGVTVVNIDNGFGAACAAMRILQRTVERPQP
jgi:pyridinium-3,5-biscarboxylic acid mononucleotide synthase